MQIQVRLFARYRELAGANLLEMDMPPGSSALDVFDAVAARYPAMVPMRNSTLMAVDADYVKPATVLQDNQELVLMPPVSGGTAC